MHVAIKMLWASPDVTALLGMHHFGKRRDRSETAEAHLLLEFHHSLVFKSNQRVFSYGPRQTEMRHVQPSRLL